MLFHHINVLYLVIDIHQRYWLFSNGKVYNNHKLIKIPLNYSFHAQHIKSNFNSKDTDKLFNNLDFTKADFKVISDELDDIDWDALFEANADPESFYNAFHNIVLDICCKLVPKKHLGR